MSGVHDAIALEALAALPPAERRIFEPYREDLRRSSWYPDMFADRSLSAAAKRKIDPQYNRYIEPAPPRSPLYRKLWQLTAEAVRENTAPPLRYVFATEYYLGNAVAALRRGDPCSAVKYCGTFSHIIADIGEPAHAAPPRWVDALIQRPARYQSFCLHSMEGLRAPVKIRGYRPRVLGVTLPRAVMGVYARLEALRTLGGYQAVPIVQALYAGRRREAVRLSTLAQNQSARVTADFMHTAFRLARSASSGTSGPPLDLRRYPFVACQVDMMYAYRPIVDRTPDFEKSTPQKPAWYPLAIRSAHTRGTETVRGLGVVPYLGPPWVRDHYRETWIEYFLVPGAYTRFRARVGVNPLPPHSVGAAVFRVLANGREVFRSREMRPGTHAQAVDVTLGQTTWLRLCMHYSKNPLRRDFDRVPALGWTLHGVWAEPVIL